MRKKSLPGLMREGNSQFDMKCTEGFINMHNISHIFQPFNKSDGTTIIPDVIIIDGAPRNGKNST